jgi:hypothetical protein
MDDRTALKSSTRPAPEQRAERIERAQREAVVPERAPISPNEFVYKLDRELDAHGEKISELRFREPTGKDIVSYGNPIRLDLSMNETHMQNQMVALAGVPPSTIGQLTAREWNTCAFELTARFFAPDLRGQTG